MLDSIRSRAFTALSSPLGNRLAPIRWTKAAALVVNDIAGRPLAPRDELVDRAERDRERRIKVAEVRAQHAQDQARESAGHDQPPIVVYFDDRSRRRLADVERILEDHQLNFKRADMEGDAATRKWVEQNAAGMGLPVVFIAGTPVGGAKQVEQAIAEQNLGRGGADVAAPATSAS